MGAHLTGILGQLMVGDAVTLMLVPVEHFRLWRGIMPAGAWRDMVEWAEKRPGMSRAIAVVEAAIGIMLIFEAIREIKQQM